MVKRNNLIWVFIIPAVAVCLVIIGLINSNLKFKTSVGNNPPTTKQILNDSIGGIVQFDNKNHIFSKEFNEDFDNSHISVNNLSITFTNIFFFPGTMDGNEKDIVSVHLTMHNYSNYSMYIYPNKAYITNKNENKVNASLINSALIGGEIKPNQFKDGDIVFPMTADVFNGKTSFKFIMTAPTDQNGKKIGEDIVFNIKYSLPVPIKADGHLGYK